MKSHPKLKRLFLKYNRKYFDGRLPTDCVLLFTKRPDMMTTYFGEFNPCVYSEGEDEILISNCVRNWPNTLKRTLLHEMVHYWLYIRPDVTYADRRNAKEDDGKHGKRFNREMLRLAKRGAFHGIW